MIIPTEPIGSIPRPLALLAALQARRAGTLAADALKRIQTEALQDTIRRFEATGSPVISDGEQLKPSFATYPLDGLDNVAPDGVTVVFADGHRRRLPRLTRGPFRYGVHAERYLRTAQRFARVPVKQAVIAASALSLIYPPEGISGYSRENFLDDLVREAVEDIRGCLRAGAYRVQIDFTEGRLAVKLDPSGRLLREFVDLNNRVLARFSTEEHRRIGVHTCPGADRDSTHSADVDYTDLLPELFRLQTDNFYIQMASEPRPEKALAVIGRLLKPGQRAFIGVIDVLDPEVESPQTVRERILQAARFIPPAQLGTTDDCGFSPFEDDTSTGRDTAFAKIHRRVSGTQLASRDLQA